MIQRNFFDAIGIADMEKVHSAVIGWMLSDKCVAFGSDPDGIRIRSELLQRIFNIRDGFEVFDHIESFIEWKSIDILVVTTKDNEKKYWIIENKIKSSQHSNQLDRYVNTMEDDYPESVQRYCFLTLINEEPRTINNVKWESCTYSQLKDNVDSALRQTMEKKDNKDFPFVLEYMKCISGLSSSLNDFINKPEDYGNVFTDGKKKKESKSVEALIENARYICENGLETIFQKCFLSQIVPKHIKIIDSFSIGETFGTALVEYTYAITDEAVFGFQFQNGTFKIQITRPNPKKRDKTKEGEFLRKWKSLLEPYHQNGWSINHQKKDNPPYFSLSSSDIFWLHPGSNAEYDDHHGEWFSKDKDYIREHWENAHSICVSILEELTRIR
jgi:hypothetical protein